MSPEQTQERAETCRRLWQAVVLRAITDATADEYASAEDRAEQRRAHEWITGRGKDFRHVCDLAGLDPDFYADAYEAGGINRAAPLCAGFAGA